MTPLKPSSADFETARTDLNSLADASKTFEATLPYDTALTGRDLRRAERTNSKLQKQLSRIQKFINNCPNSANKNNLIIGLKEILPRLENIQTRITNGGVQLGYLERLQRYMTGSTTKMPSVTKVTTEQEAAVARSIEIADLEAKIRSYEEKISVLETANTDLQEGINTAKNLLNKTTFYVNPEKQNKTIRENTTKIKANSLRISELNTFIRTTTASLERLNPSAGRSFHK